MIDLSVNEIIHEINGSLIKGSADSVIKSISIDSRNIKSGDLFIAIEGENHKGEDFIEDALGKGAIGYIAKNVSIDSEIVIKVDDPLKALQAISSIVLKKIAPKVIAITGSTGKTSVKDMLESILSLKYEVVASYQNFNNEIGLPLTLLRIGHSTEVIVLEMAMRGLGQISELCEIAPADMALITNIGKTHIGLLKNEENIIKAKSEIITSIKDKGVVFLNSEDKNTKSLRPLAENIVCFGKNSANDVSFSDLEIDEWARPSFNLRTKAGQVKINLPCAGKYQVYNASAAAAVAGELGVEIQTIKKGLEKTIFSPNRADIVRANGYIIVNDTYNASPISMSAAIKALKDFKSGRKVAVLGDMKELGAYAKKEHQKIGKQIAGEGIDSLITVGTLAKDIADAAVDEGMNKEQVKSYDNTEDLQKEIVGYLTEGDVILIKASRALKLDELVSYLQKKR